MLVPAMTNEEITKEVTRDARKIDQVQMPRLLEVYNKERKRCKIDRRATWAKEYIIEMPKTKNTWMLVFQKNPAINKYRDASDLIYCNVTWYYGPKGLRVFRPAKNDIEVYNAHLFNRYNERMNLNLSRPLDIIKRFFLNSGMLLPEPIIHDDKEYMMSVCKEGAILGNYHQQTTLPWLVNNTFITHRQMHKKQVDGVIHLFDSTLARVFDEIKNVDDHKIEEIQKQVKRYVDYVHAVA